MGVGEHKVGEYMDEPNKSNSENEKWIFEDYAFIIAAVLFGVLMLLGILLDANDIALMFISGWWPFSWMFFMFAWSACLVKEVIDIKRGAGDADDDLEGKAEEALYVGITTVMLLIGIINDQMYSSWLAGPITFVILTVIWPFLRHREERGQKYFPVIPVILLIAGITVEIVLGGWIAFPVSWILISAVKVYKLIREYMPTEDIMLDIMYHSFTIIFLSISLFMQLWIISWLGYPLAVIISKIVGKARSSRDKVS